MNTDLSKRDSHIDIVFTGPECTAKSSLAARLSKQFDLPLVKEYARTYLHNINRDYTIQDLVNIAKGQYLEGESKSNCSITIHDTDLITIVIWANEVFGFCPQEIMDFMNVSENKIYLLMYPDIPWEHDVLRENEYDRIRLFNIYESFLAHQNSVYYIINGKGEERYNNVVNTLIKSNILLNIVE